MEDLKIHNNRNQTDFEKLNNYQKLKKINYIDDYVKKERIEKNLETWEQSISKHFNLPFNKKIQDNILKIKPFRAIINSQTSINNEKIAYSIAKHFIGCGIPPSKITIVNIDDCYLSARGFGEQGEIKKKIFDESNKIIIIENVRDIKNTDIMDNVITFWDEMFNLLKKQKKLNLLLCFEVSNSNNWFPTKMNKKEKERFLKDLSFLII